MGSNSLIPASSPCTLAFRFLSSVTESQIIAAVLTFGVLFCSFVMEGIESFFSDTALSSMLAVLVLVVLLALVIYQMTKDALLSSVVGAGMGAVVLILYAVKACLLYTSPSPRD